MLGLPSATPSATPASAAATATPVNAGGTLQVLDLRAWPNPDPAYVSVLLDGAADAVDVKVYSAALDRVAVLSAGPCAAGWVRIPLPADRLAALPKGLYFMRAVARRGALQSLPAKPGRFMLLR